MELKNAIFDRRSVREFTAQRVDRETITGLIQAAIQAPSAMNQQPWAFTIIQDKTLLKQYSDRAKQIFATTSDSASMPAELKEMLSDPAYNIFYNSGTLIVIWAKPMGQHPDWDCCLAAENLMLAAHDLGLGTCPIGLAWPLFEQADVKQALNVPVKYRPVFPIIVGHPSKRTPEVARNKPEIVCWR